MNCYLSVEGRLKRALVRAQRLAWKAGFTVLSGVLQEGVNAVATGDSGSRGDDWVSLPENDEDIDGMCEYLSWRARRSGWGSADMKYITRVCAAGRRKAGGES